MYVDGYVLPVPKKNLKAYLRMARVGERMWRKHGAIDYKECVGDDLKTKWGTPFTRMMKLKPGEIVVFSYIVFKSRAHRDRVNARVMKEMTSMDAPNEMPFDIKRFATAVVSAIGYGFAAALYCLGRAIMAPQAHSQLGPQQPLHDATQGVEVTGDAENE